MSLYDLEDEPMFHMEYRAGRWWVCVLDECDGEHHYYQAS